jgi:DNA-binding beta-propeller fold protein YncE
VLAALERELEGEPFVAIGVHSPKFPNERDADMVRQAVRRYGITHPVVVDSGMEIWRRFGVRAWPTLVLLDAEGRVAATGSGEPDRGPLLAAVRGLLDDARELGLLAGGPPAVRREPPAAGSLSYPGKVVADGDRVYVSDTGHNQVVVASLAEGEVARIGSGEPGLADGPFAEARFSHPNGLALVGGDLLVADTGNHALRRVDLAAGTVGTVAGTGEKGRGIRREAGPASAIALRSPWDLAWDGSLLYVAMAGAHQIWFYDPAAGEAGPFAGTGREACVDGPAGQAAFAQPSGLALLGAVLWVADSEVSSVRAVEGLSARPWVRLAAGSGDLFGFGDRDGPAVDALFQHPIGIAPGDGVLYVADSYNHKVRVLDPAEETVRTLFGGRGPERVEEVYPALPLPPAGPFVPAFHEPEGLWLAGDELLVADTNNHRIVAVRLDDGSRRVLLGG